MSVMRLSMQLCCGQICNAEENKCVLRSLANIRNYPKSTGVGLLKISVFGMARNVTKWGLEN
jgi:hypothetical protein